MAASRHRPLPSYQQAGRLQPPGTQMAEKPSTVKAVAQFTWLFGKTMTKSTVDGYVGIIHSYCELGLGNHLLIDGGLHASEKSVAEGFSKTLRIVAGVSAGLSLGCLIGESIRGHRVEE
jgi:hypothetical protein